MAIQQASFYCPVCQQQRLFTAQNQVNQVFYLILTLFSCGLFAIIWLILNLSYTPRYHCSQCGHSDSYKYLADPYLRSQEAQQNALRAARGETSPLSSNSFIQWFSGFSTRKKVLMVVLVLFSVPFIGGILSAIHQTNQRSNTNANTAINIAVPSQSPPPSSNQILMQVKTHLDSKRGYLDKNDYYFVDEQLRKIPQGSAEYDEAQRILKQYAKQISSAKLALKSNATAKNSCADIESELASVKSDQARVEEMLDTTEDFGEQAGSPKKAIYLNALKQKGQLQLQQIALERKLKACGKRK